MHHPQLGGQTPGRVPLLAPARAGHQVPGLHHVPNLGQADGLDVVIEFLRGVHPV